MKIFVIGHGGREHALVWKLTQSHRVSQVWVASGNGGTTHGVTRNIALDEDNFPVLIDFVRQEKIDLTVVGPEAPLVAGIVDAFQSVGLPCFGPTKAASKLEASKAFAKRFMVNYHIPTGRYAVFTKHEEAMCYLREVDYEIVIKVSGLAAGKGVIIPKSYTESTDALHKIMIERVFGTAGGQVLIEERLYGPEVSVLAFCDGERAIPMPPAQDHKTIFSGNRGPNTGGMGAYAPSPLVTPTLLNRITRTVLQPTIDALRNQGTPFVGVLFAGLMLTEYGPQVLEYNCRFGDPEAQAILPLLSSDLVDVLEAALEGNLSSDIVQWKPGAAATVVAATEGYPGSYSKGHNITGVAKASALPGVIVFHAGTHQSETGELITTGGRVLAVTGISDTLPSAVQRAYTGLAHINFQGMYFRSDIGVGQIEFIPLTEASDIELRAISEDRRLALNLTEMQAIQNYYRQEGREPTDVELETLAQTWSEHCIHKSFKAYIIYVGPDGVQQIDSLLDTYIRAATDKINKPWIRSAFVDNAGIVAFDNFFDLAFKVETHNHPSALDPFAGANTGVGGVMRDIMGVSAYPIAITNVLCFGPEYVSYLSPGLLHPRQIADGVTSGIEDYGNKTGIPTVNGAILYDPGYTANPLVFCGCLGILPRGSHPTCPEAGDQIVAIGSPTGRDGLRGATFSSLQMAHSTSGVASAAIQSGNPIYQKQILEVILIARNEKLYTAINDCGAGGFSSAIGEMSAELGAEVHLERAPLKFPGLQSWEVWLSESQERMVLAVPESNWMRLLEICQTFDVEATNLGVFNDSGRLNLYYEDRLVGQFANDFLHEGIPQGRLQAAWKPPIMTEPDIKPTCLTANLLALLALPNTRSKEDVIRRYDHEVQAGVVVKPLVGLTSIGPSDGAVLRPLDARSGNKGVALSVGINPRYGLIDPYAMAWAAIDEAIRNCVAVGGDPDQLSLLDNFCWGDPNSPKHLGELVRCTQGCYDAAVAYETPFISGKDSFNNEYIDNNNYKHTIPGTLLISAAAIVPDVTRTVTSDLKKAGNQLCIVGLTRNELGGSIYYQHHNLLGANVPQPPEHGLNLFRALHRAIRAGLVQSCHDCSEGGLAVSAAEMALGGGLGLEIDLAAMPRTSGRSDQVTFSESLGRFIIEVATKDIATLEEMFTNLPIARIGYVRRDAKLQINGLKGQPIIETDLEAINQVWRGHLDT